MTKQITLYNDTIVLEIRDARSRLIYGDRFNSKDEAEIHGEHYFPMAQWLAERQKYDEIKYEVVETEDSLCLQEGFTRVDLDVYNREESVGNFISYAAGQIGTLLKRASRLKLQLKMAKDYQNKLRND